MQSNMGFDTSALCGECNSVKYASFVKTVLWPAELFAAFQDSVWCHLHLWGDYNHYNRMSSLRFCSLSLWWNHCLLLTDSSAGRSKPGNLHSWNVIPQHVPSWKRRPLPLSHAAFQLFSQRQITALSFFLLTVAGLLRSCGAQERHKDRTLVPHVVLPSCGLSNLFSVAPF